ncbi:MAG: prepilin-type N-terminal cleavage/methylation domain-containing protein [Candidatus Omnitrophica bacterium]|nr:prepilin-type N-terminal cleavage/methylation domain-containing protein [Candidatus Omnitrophota bacterium]
MMISKTGKKQRIAYSGKRIEGGVRLSAKRYALNAERGLSLVEVLLAVSILALGITGVLQGYASSITALEAGQYNVEIINLLKNKMAEVEIMLRGKKEIVQGNERGTFEEPYRDFSWEWNIQEAEKEDLYALTVRVFSDFNPREISLTTYVAGKKSEEE